MAQRRLVRLCCLLLSCSMLGSPSAQVSSQAQLPTDPAVKIGKLPNGFTYYIRRNTVQPGKVIIHLVNKAGSILETEKQRGLAHFLEHMAFNGTTHYPKNELVGYLEKLGVRFGADLNAYTAFNQTVYMLPILMKDNRQLHDGLQVARDWAQGITLSDEEIEKERGVIMEELRLHLGAGSRLEPTTFPIMFNHSLYAQRAPIGLEDVILHCDHKELKQFYEDWYRPDLQALVVAGDIDVKDAEKQIKSLYGDLKMPANPKPRPNVRIPLTGQNQFAAISDPEITQTSMDIMIKFPALVVKTNADYAEDLSRQVLTTMISQRFNEVMQQEQPPFLQAGLSFSGLEGGVDALAGGVTARKGKLEEGIRAWWQEILRMKQQGFTPKELQRTKELFTAQMDQLVKEQDKADADQFVSKYEENFLTGDAIPDAVEETKLNKAVLDTLTVPGINSTLNKYLKDTDRDIIIRSNSKDAATLPTEGVMTAWINDEARKPMVAYQDRSVNHTALLDTKPAGGKIAAEKQLTNIGATDLVLSNGIHVVLKTTKFKNDQIIFNGYSKGGMSQVSDADFYSGNMAANIVGASGVGSWSQLELSQFLSKRSFGAQPYINNNYQGIQGGGNQDHLEDMLQLVYLYFTKPRRDPVAFNNLIQQMREGLASAVSSPQKIFNDTIQAVLGNHHFRNQPLPLEKIGNVQLDQALAIYKDRFSDAGSFTFVFVGNFDMNMMKDLVALYLGSLPGLGRQEDIKDLSLTYPTGRTARKVYGGIEPKATVLLAWPGKFDYKVETGRKMNALAHMLTYHLISKVREEQAGVYNINASARTTQYPAGQYLYTINFVCDPENVESLILSINSEIAAMKTNGPTDDDIAKFKAEYRSFLSQGFNDNSLWLNYMTEQLQINGEISAVDLDERLKPITQQSIRETAQQYFNNENYIRIVELPAAKK